MIPYGKHFVDEDDVRAVSEILRRGWLTQGPEIAAFEQAVTEYTGARYAVALASGSAALHLASIAAGVGPGKSLITSPITFVASANGALYCDGTPEFCDVDPATVNIDPDALARQCHGRQDIAAIVPVHFAGLPCEMDRVQSIAAEAGAMVIEDAAHALGAHYPDGQRVGCCSYSDMTVFSFHPVKAIAAGEGGMITTNSETIYRQLLRLRAHGINKLDDPLLQDEEAYTDGEKNPWYYEMQELGYHYRITDIQSALGRSQLGKIDMFIARRKELALQYDRLLQNVPHIRPAQTTGRDLSGHHIYPVRIDYRAAGQTRGTVMNALRDREVGTQVHYIPVTTQPYYRQMGFSTADYPQAESYYAEALTIPLYYGLTDDEQSHVADTLRDVLT